MDLRLDKIAAQFDLASSIGTISPYGSGHINDTYCVYATDDATPLYILQRLNHHVFSNIPALKTNIVRITSHIRNKLSQNPDADIQREVLTPLPTKAKDYFYRDAAGNYWGMYVFIQSSVLYDTVQSESQAYQAGKAFGRFIQLLSDFPAGELHESIPNFHNMLWRLEQFLHAKKADKAGRLGEVEPEITFVETRAERMLSLPRYAADGILPQRITHNDTKLNNILFDTQGRALCVIDLDTVMPGLIHYDFGDSIRSITSGGVEDETDLSSISFNVSLYTAYTQGFLGELHSILTPLELETLAFGAQYMTFIMGLRFLTDYLNGDTYYKTHYAAQNLARARSQFALLGKMECVAPEMQQVVEKYSKL